jgi:hypothetical protein
MEFNINLPKCKPNSKEPMTTTISSKDIELKLRSSMRFSKNSTKVRKRRPMTNSREYSKLKRN